MTDTNESWSVIKLDPNDIVPINDLEVVKEYLYPNMLFFSDRRKCG